MKTFKQLRENELAKQVLASAKKVSPTARIDTRSSSERRADTDKMLAARAAAKPKVTSQPIKPSTPEQQIKNQNASMAASYAKHKPGQYVGDSVELEGESINEDQYEQAENSKKMTQVARGVAEASSAAARMQKALQKAKEDRERSERNAERLLNPVKKPAPIEQVKEENPGLYANIHAKRKRIAAGSGERMRKPGSKGAPTAKAFKQAQKTVKENIDDGVSEGIARLISKSIKNVTATKKTPQEKADIRLNNLNK